MVVTYKVLSDLIVWHCLIEVLKSLLCWYHLKNGFDIKITSTRPRWSVTRCPWVRLPPRRLNIDVVDLVYGKTPSLSLFDLVTVVENLRNVILSNGDETRITGVGISRPGWMGLSPTLYTTSYATCDSLTTLPKMGLEVQDETMLFKSVQIQGVVRKYLVLSLLLYLWKCSHYIVFNNLYPIKWLVKVYRKFYIRGNFRWFHEDQNLKFLTNRSNYEELETKSIIRKNS